MEEATNLLALDDVEAQLRELWRIGEQLCTQCNGYHRLWGVLRAAGVVGGPRIDEGELPPVIAESIHPGGHILIAGAADAGLLQLVVHATAARPIAVTVADLCPAPLALIDRIASPADVAVETLQVDLTLLDHDRRYDLVLSHGMLPFVAPAPRRGILNRLHRSLKPGGKLVLVLRTVPAMSRSAKAGHDDAWLDRAREKLALRPDLIAFCGPALDEALIDHARGRGNRQVFEQAEEVVALLASSGFHIDRHLSSGEGVRLRIGEEIFARQSHIFVAVPDRAAQ